MHRIAVVDAVDLRGLEEARGADLHGPQRRRGVRGEVRVPGPRGHDDHVAPVQVPQRPAPDVRLRHLPHLQRRHHPRRDPLPLQRVLQGQGVDHRRQHAHVVALRPVHPGGRALEPTENVAAAHHDPHLHAQVVELCQLAGGQLHDPRVQAKSVGPGQRLAAEFQHDPPVTKIWVRCRRRPLVVSFFHEPTALDPAASKHNQTPPPPPVPPRNPPHPDAAPRPTPTTTPAPPRRDAVGLRSPGC